MKSDFERVQQIEKRITAACDWAVKQGYVLISGDWNAYPKGMCALGACTQEEFEVRRALSRHPTSFAKNELNMSSEELDAFTSAWDGASREAYLTESENMCFNLGTRLREKYEPMDDRDYRHR